MRVLGPMVVVLLFAGVASAQPGQTPPQPQPYGPSPYAYPAYGYQRQVMPVQLTLDEQYLLQRGYISDGEHIGGGIVSVFFGWGIGQAVQGRWSEKGYIFTLGEGASLAVLIWGVVRLARAEDRCFDDPTCRSSSDEGVGMVLAGMAGLTVFRVWEIYDAFAGPAEHNRKLRALQMRLGMPVPIARVSPFLTSPKGDTGGAVAGVTLRF